MSRKSRRTSNVARRRSQPRKESIKAEDIKKEVAVTVNSDLENEKIKEVTTLEETVKVKEANSDNNVKEEVLKPKTEVKEELTNKKDAETKLEEKEIKEEAKEIIEEAKEVINEVNEVIDEEKEPVRYINIIGDKAIKLYSINKNGTEYKITALLKDFAYEKDVKIKYTFDGWNTYKEEGMYYCSSGYDTEQLNEDRLQVWDKYLSIEDNEKKNFEFVLYYGVNGYDYWDNNDEKNYKIEG
ncbi:MAG: hypothetical protein ACLR02_10805 [Clostridium sp.]|jgi:hypothetical protein|nr:hypothetical protein [Clostridium sp.]